MDEQKNNTPLKDEALEEVQGGSVVWFPHSPQNMGGVVDFDYENMPGTKLTISAPEPEKKKDRYHFLPK